MGAAGTLVRALTHMLAPHVCRVCGETLTPDERVMCLNCYMHLPRTGIHTDDFNMIHRRLGHHCKVDRAAGWFIYTRNTPYAKLLVDAKYGDLPQISYTLGADFAKELTRDSFFHGIDALVPMPMHWWKRWRRGYNQADELARGIASVTGIPVSSALKAARPHGILSRKGRSARFSSISGTMVVSDAAAISGRHILIVDDIITTGASVSEAIRALSAASPAAISVLCLGLTAKY